MKQNINNAQSGTTDRKHNHPKFLRIICVMAVLTLLLSGIACFNTSAAVKTDSMKITQAQAKTYSGKYLYCTASDFVSLRKCPSASSTELAKIPHGYCMTYMNYKTGKWYYVRYSGQYGYVYEDYVTFDGDSVNSYSSPGSSGSSQSCSGTYLYCTADDFVSLRKRASSSSTELAKIYHGYKMTYLNYKSGKWYYVKYGSQTGYVYEDYVTFDSSKVAGDSTDTLYCTASDFVSLRKGPSANTTELVKIPRGKSMTYLRKTVGKWYYVQYGRKKGYVYEDYVSAKKPC